MKVLLIQPKYPDTYWSFKHALKFVSKKAANPPLGLITMSQLLPTNWEKRLIDLNVSACTDKDIQWADYVFIGAMSVQLESVNKVIAKCKQYNKKIVAGGPLFTEEHERFDLVDHFVLNEAELTMPLFLADFANGCPQRLYQSTEFADMTKSPIPDYSLLKHNKYATLSVQYSRGCPFNCEFCDITALFGFKVRTKTPEQIIQELDNLLKLGSKGSVFFVDDNFIGNKKKVKTELLPVMIAWMKKNKYPFTITTEASIDLADDDELLRMMVQAGFTKAFIGIETPEELCLHECKKTQNSKRDLVACVKKIQTAGIEVSAGFIVGFDNDPASIFQQQIDFIQNTSIISAMVGLLNALPKTMLYKRLNAEGRIVAGFTGDNTNYSINFKPIMDKEELMTGYQKILHGIYNSKSYYERIHSFLKRYNPPLKVQRTLTFNDIFALLKSILYIGILKKNRKYYWKLFFWSMFRKPSIFPLAITYSIYGYHFRKVFGNLA